jgi:chromosome segregation ATPase
VKLYSVFIVDGERVDPKGTEGKSVKVRKLLASFGTKVYLEVLERELKEKESNLKDLIKEREKNLKLQDKAEKGIQKDSLAIGSHETDVSLLKGQSQSATERYNEKKSSIAKTKFADKDAAKEAKGELKDLDKERKGIEKEIEKHSNEILDLKSDARDYGYELKQLKEGLESLEQKLVLQREVVNRAKEELKVFK